MSKVTVIGHITTEAEKENVMEITTNLGDKITEAMVEEKNAKERQAQKRQARIAEEREEAKRVLGAEFGKALRWWRANGSNKQKKFSVGDWTRMVTYWRTLQSLVINKVTSETDVASIYDQLTKLFPVNGENTTLEDKQNYILAVLERFDKDANTTRIHKDTNLILKMSLDDINFEGDVPVFDSRKATNFVKGTLGKAKAMRWVAIAESAVSRKIQELGVRQLVIDMSKGAFSKEEEATLLEEKMKLFHKGIMDVADGALYLPSAPSASATRQAQCPFITANTPQEVYRIWGMITGFTNLRSILAGIGKKTENGYEFNPTKLKARISTNGSASHNTIKLIQGEDEEFIHHITHPVVLNLPDCEGVSTADYKIIGDDSFMKFHTGEETPTTPCDGESLISLKQAAREAYILRLISRVDMEAFIDTIDAHVTLRDLFDDTTFQRINHRIPDIFQVRVDEAGGKGILVKFPLEFFAETSNYEIVTTKGFMKFMNPEKDDFVLDICNYSKPHTGWVNMNPQFIEALEYENPNTLCHPLVDQWIDRMKESLTSQDKLLEFTGSLGNPEESSDSETNSSIDTIRRILTTCSSLRDDKYVIQLISQQYVKLLKDMSIGKIKVHGAYTYMVCDPMAIMHQLNNSYPMLGSNKYWFQGKDGVEAGLFRSPLLVPQQAQKVTLSSESFYDNMYHDVLVMNSQDGFWGYMAGADFDGDECAVVSSDTDDGALIVSGIINHEFQVLSPSFEATKMVVEDGTDEELEARFTELLADFNAASTRVGKTGNISNEAMRSRDIALHLNGLVYFAEKQGCDSIWFDADKSHKYLQPVIKTVDINGHHALATGALLRSVTTDGKQYAPENAPEKSGLKTFEEVRALANKYMENALRLSGVNDIEIDSAKTGMDSDKYHADELKETCTPDWMINRHILLGRPLSAKESRDAYCSFSPMGRLHQYVCHRARTEFDTELDYFNVPALVVGDRYESRQEKAYRFCQSIKAGRSLIGLPAISKEDMLRKLLTDVEKRELTSMVTLTDGSNYTLEEYIAIRKENYGKKVRTAMMNSSDESERMNNLHMLKENEILALEQSAQNTGISLESIACACYFAAYRNTKMAGLSYGWLLQSVLLSVFSRANENNILVRIPDNTENATVIEEQLYVNGSSYKRVIGASDMDVVPVETINGKKYAYIRKDVLFDNSKAFEKITDLDTSVEYVIDLIYGFKYRDSGSVEGFKEMVRSNNYAMDIAFDDTHTVVAKVGDLEVAVLKRTDNGVVPSDLVGHTVIITKVDKWYESSAKGFHVVVR